LANLESDLLEIAHTEKSELGLVSKIAFQSAGLLVDPERLPDDWSQLRAPAVLALALRRFNLLSLSLGSSIGTVDQDLARPGA
jgi:hypothetical protein